MRIELGRLLSETDYCFNVQYSSNLPEPSQVFRKNFW